MSAMEKDSFTSGTRTYMGDISKKLDTVGNNIQVRDMEERQQLQKIKQEDEIILKSFPKNQDSLLNHKFYIIDFLYRVEYKVEYYQPLEMSILKFSMKDGVIDVFHTFITPGESEHGLRGPARVHSDETHKIPYDFKFGESDYQFIWEKLGKFLGLDKPNAICPLIFVLDKRRLMAAYSLDLLFGSAGIPGNSPIRTIYSLENMFVLLKYLHHPDLKKASFMIQKLTVARAAMITNEFDYVSNMLCEWHDQREVNHCALGKIRTYAYVILFDLKKTYKFKLTVNHSPIIEDGNSCIIVDDINMSMGMDRAPMVDRNHKEAMKYSNNMMNSDWISDCSDIRYKKQPESNNLPSSFKKANEKEDKIVWAKPVKVDSTHKYKSPWGNSSVEITSSKGVCEEDFPAFSSSNTGLGTWAKSGQSTANQAKVQQQPPPQTTSRPPPGLNIQAPSNTSAAREDLDNPSIDSYFTVNKINSDGGGSETICDAVNSMNIQDVPRTGWTGRRRV